MDDSFAEARERESGGNGAEERTPGDMILRCVECGCAFPWAVGEQEFYRARGLSTPRRCSYCRKVKRERYALVGADGGQTRW